MKKPFISCTMKIHRKLWKSIEIYTYYLLTSYCHHTYYSLNTYLLLIIDLRLTYKLLTLGSLHMYWIDFFLGGVADFHYSTTENHENWLNDRKPWEMYPRKVPQKMPSRGAFPGCLSGMPFRKTFPRCLSGNLFQHAQVPFRKTFPGCPSNFFQGAKVEWWLGILYGIPS